MSIHHRVGRKRPFPAIKVDSEDEDEEDKPKLKIPRYESIVKPNYKPMNFNNESEQLTLIKRGIDYQFIGEEEPLIEEDWSNVSIVVAKHCHCK